jgi:hypothetical protein
MAEPKMPNKITNIFKQGFSFDNSMIQFICFYFGKISGKDQSGVNLKQFKYCKGYVKNRPVIDFLSCGVSLKSADAERYWLIPNPDKPELKIEDLKLTPETFSF